MTTEQIINQAINSAETPAAPAVETPVVEPVENQATNETEPTEPTKVEEPFSKKAINALSRRDKKIGKLQAEYAALQAELQKYREQESKQQPSGAPNEADYDNYGEFLKAQILHEVNQKQAESSKKQEEAYTTAQQQAWLSERQETLAERAAEAATKVPDYVATFNEYQDVISSLPDYISHAMLELDNAPMAFYALAKEGKLESLATMTPARAIMEIGRAEERGIAMTKAKPVTKAPTPISGNKGTGTAGKSLHNMTTQEKLAWLKT